ncbi:MAG: M4 family metallopeptidase [Stagnimonas sp.]|nr:M4 family metallopeptidase [Stagnimonas sp.]
MKIAPFRNPAVYSAALSLFLSCLAGAAQALPERALSGAEEALARLRLNTGGALHSQRAPELLYSAVHSLGSTPLLTDNNAAAPEERAKFFLSVYGSLFGVQDPISELKASRLSRDAAGNQHLHLDQKHRGLPVFGARLVVHMNDRGIIGGNGAFVPDLDELPSTPSRPVASLREGALAEVRKHYPGVTGLVVESSRLMYYRSGLLKGVPGKSYLAYEVLVRGGRPEYPVRERLILDASSGTVLNRINEIHSLLNREIYAVNMSLPPVLTEGSPLAPADIPLAGDVNSDPTSRIPRIPTDNLYIFAGGTYALYQNLFGREGYDDGFIDPATGEPRPQVQRSVYLVNTACPNAYWDGISTNYCPGFDADDVVSHEWSHAYTEYTHGLVYQYQSGALNEAYSDIFGETYDLVNGIEGPLGVTLTEGEYFEDGGSRWVLGEDLTETAAGLLLRDMWDPDNFSVNVPLLGIPILANPSPGSVITSENYYCGTDDGGGVHTNSGVPNHMYAMLVDGKEFNGITIPKIGMTKAAQIYFQAETHYQTPTTNFAQHADALAMACQDLIGAPINDVLGQPSAEPIRQADCAAVELASTAVELRLSPKEKCNYQPVLKPEAETPVCGEGLSPVASFSETWEGGAVPSGWTLSSTGSGDAWPDTNWVVSSELPAPHAGKAAFAIDSNGGSCAAGGDISGSFSMDSPEIGFAEAGSKFSFTHFMQSEAEYDGGNLKVSIDGSDFALVPAEAYSFNPYNGALDSSTANTNPLAGEAAWTGSDQGEATGSWGTTIVELDRIATVGDKLKFRWEFSQDGCAGNLGWFVDDVSVYSCKAGGSSSGGSSGGSSGSGSSGGSGSGSSSGGSSGSGSSSGSEGRFGGAFGWLLLAPMFGAAALRRHRPG